MKYIQLQPESSLPDISSLSPFRTVVVIEETVTHEWQYKVSEWLVRSGCLYMMAWGNKCSSWDDSVDNANLEEYNFEEIPENKFVMTTWHEDEPLKEVFFFAKHNGFHSEVELENTLLLHVSNTNKEKEFKNEYAGV